MKLIHLSDLHLGKRVNEFSMLDDQKYILEQIISVTDDEHPDAVIIAGDVYDKPVPPADAVQVFDEFLVKLAARGIKTFVISGNHDSAERIAFGGRLMTYSGIYISHVYNGDVPPVTLADEYGNVNFYLLPFIKPAHVRASFPDEEILSYTDAMECAIRHMDINAKERNILVTHQLAAGAERCESEDISIGGTDGVSADVFDVFDYTALGHLHSPQRVGRDNIRYCGTPLKYSFSEAKHKKSVTVVDMAKKGDVKIHTVPLTPIHDMREIRGSYDELTDRRRYINTATDDYMHITLTDEDDVPDAIIKLRTIYQNLMRLDYDNTRTRHNAEIELADNIELKSPAEMFAEFYEMQNGRPISDMQRDFTERLISSIWEDDGK